MYDGYQTTTDSLAGAPYYMMMPNKDGEEDAGVNYAEEYKKLSVTNSNLKTRLAEIQAERDALRVKLCSLESG
jgi:hypothetical protein